MIAFGCAIGDAELYRRYAEPGVRLAAEPGAAVFPQAAPRSVAPIYNLILDLAAALEELEALVIVDEQAELLDPDLGAKLRDGFADPSVAIIGAAGARAVRSIAWWEGDDSWTSSRYRPRELEGAELPGLLSDEWRRETSEPAGPGEVDVVDGALFCLSPWAVRHLRFDETLGPRYGFDFDFCQQARAAGRRVLLLDIALAMHRPLAVVTDPETFAEAHMRAARKWDDRLPFAPARAEPRARARRAEAEAAAARLLSATKMYEAQALARAQERELADATGSLSWRVTAPARYAAALGRGLRRRGR